ncbi:MAG: glycosyltransferase [Acidobacteria bacterium]|nr:glycosyltransferase [Acidobacteriota bacterium]
MTWLTAGLDPARFETLLITGTVPPGEGDMSWFAHQAGITPVIIPEMSRELSLKDILVIFKLLREMIRFKPDIIHTHKAKAGAAGRSAGLIYKLLTGGRCKIIHTYHGHIFHSYYGKAKTSLFISIERALARLATDIIITISEQQRGDTRALQGWKIQPTPRDPTRHRFRSEI